MWGAAVVLTSLRMITIRLLAGSGVLLLLAGMALADEAQRLRVEAAKLVYAAERAQSERQRRALLKEAHGKLARVQERYPSSYVQLQVYLGGKRTNMSPDDILKEAGLADSPDLEGGNPDTSGKRTKVPLDDDDDPRESTAVHFANLDAGNLREILGREFSVTAEDENGWTDLHYAAALNLVALAEALVDAGASTDASLKDDGAPVTEQLNQSLKALGVESNFISREGQQPLHVAVNYGAVDTAELLIDRGADIKAKDKNGQTPLEMARRKDPFGKVMWLLINRGAM